MKIGKIILENESVIELKFYDDAAPNTVANFEKLANSEFYDGLTFHRVIPGFVSQGGCPYGTGTGGPGYTIKCETMNNPYQHVPGALSMAHAGRNTGGSQFFICHEDFPHLDGVHTVFGIVTSGLEFVLNMAQGTRIRSIRVTEA